MAPAKAMAAPVRRAGTNENDWAMNPVTMGARAPPMKPPKFCSDPSEAMRFDGAAVVASAQEQAEAALARKITTEMQARAMVLLSASAAGTVKAAMPSMAATTGMRRPLTGE